MRDNIRDREGDDQAVVYIRYTIFFIVGAFLWGLDGGVGMMVIYFIIRFFLS